MGIKTFGEIKKGDKLYIVNTGTAIPGGVEIIVNEALTDYSNDLPYQNTTIYGILIANPFGGEMPLCFNAEETSSGMYFTSLEEAMQKATDTANEKIKEYEDEILSKMNEVFKIHEQMVLLNLKKQSWEKI